MAMGSTIEIHGEFGWPQEISVVHVTSTADGSQQPSLWYSPSDDHRSNNDEDSDGGGNGRRPLLIALHTWSADFRQGGGQVVFGQWCIQKGWHFLHPNFRGPNNRPEACGSELALQDILDAIDHVKLSTGTVDEDRIYVVGVSGGGHMALLLAAQYPHLWAGVSAWAAISDLEVWWKVRSNNTSECSNHVTFQKYAHDIERVCGGAPGSQDSEAMDECRKRSPVTYLAKLFASDVHLDINAGITDGRKGGSVPFWHSLQAYNTIQSEQNRFSNEWINSFYETRLPPPSHLSHIEMDPLYQNRAIYFRHVKDSVRLTIFEGGHEILHVAALNWLAQQRKGYSTVWDINPDIVHQLEVHHDLTESGK